MMDSEEIISCPDSDIEDSLSDPEYSSSDTSLDSEDSSSSSSSSSSGNSSSDSENSSSSNSHLRPDGESQSSLNSDVQSVDVLPRDWEKVQAHQNDAFIYESELLLINSYRLNDEATPFDILKKFFSNDVMEKIQQESNRYASQNFKPAVFLKFKEISVDELWCFFGLNILMGILHKPAIDDYWTTDELLSTPYFGKIMSRNRFKEILRALHFSNNDTADISNRLNKFGEIRDTLYDTCRKILNPGEVLSLDETLVLYKGRLSFIKYFPTKRARFGIMLYVICDAKTNYVLNSKIYVGKTTKFNFSKNDFGVGGAAVLHLLEPYFNLGHKLFIDNYYNSPKLAMELYKKKINVCGTVKKTRKDMPKSNSKMKLGEVVVFTKGPMMVERWIDRRDVWTLSTGYNHAMIEVESGKRNRNGERLKKFKPETINEYNKYMGKVDNVDRTLKPYNIKRKTIKWYKKVFFHDVDTMIFNSFVVFKMLQQDISLPFKKFKRDLAYLIMQNHRKRNQKPVSRNLQATSLRFNGAHFPAKIDNYRRCVVCTKGKGQKGKTRVETKIICETCQVSLCTTPCFKIYHTLKDLNGITEPTNNPDENNHGESSAEELNSTSSI